MNQLIEIYIAFIGAMMSFGYYPQAYKIWRRKSGSDVSLITYYIFGIGTLSWTLYGWYISNFTIIISFIFGVFGSWLVVALTLYYRSRNSGVE